VRSPRLLTTAHYTSVNVSSRQLPISSSEEWHSVASDVEAVDLDLVAADHEVRVDLGR
jgi:hypothetical protein